MLYPAIRENDLITYVFSAGTATPLITAVVVLSSNNIQVDSLKIALASDIVNTPVLAVTYSTLAASIPGTANITVDSWNETALNTSKDGENIAITTGAQTGIARLTPAIRAQTPGSPNIPDPTPYYLCTLAITATHDKLTSD